MNNIEIEFINSENKKAFSYNELKGVDVSLISDFRYEINIEELLFDSCINNDHALLQKLIDIDADVNIQNNYGYTPLMYACRNKSVKCVKILMENNADVNVNAKDDFGSTPLTYACRNNSFECVKLLIENNVDVNVKDGFGLGNTALMYTCRNKSFECAKLLIESNADVNIQNYFEETALMVAKTYGNKKMVELLKKA